MVFSEFLKKPRIFFRGILFALIAALAGAAALSLALLAPARVVPEAGASP